MSSSCDPMDCSLPGSPAVGFSRREYWGRLPFPSPGDLLDLGIKPRSPTLQAISCIAGRLFTDWARREARTLQQLPAKFQEEILCSAVLSHSVVSDSATPWTVVSQTPLSMRFSTQEYWSGLPCPPPADLPNPGFNPHLLHCRGILYQLGYQWRNFSIIIIFIVLEVFLKR